MIHLNMDMSGNILIQKQIDRDRQIFLIVFKINMLKAEQVDIEIDRQKYIDKTDIYIDIQVETQKGRQVERYIGIQIDRLID